MPPTVLTYTFPNPLELRTSNVLEEQPEGNVLTLFKIQTFSNNQTCETDFYRFNKLTQRDELAGGIQWSMRSTTVSFGAIHIPFHELRRKNKAASQSRRFRWNNSEYKWKRSERHLMCYDRFKRVIANYNDDTRRLEVSDRGYALLDQIVVTCLLHRWVISQGYW